MIDDGRYHIVRASDTVELDPQYYPIYKVTSEYGMDSNGWKATLYTITEETE